MVKWAIMIAFACFLWERNWVEASHRTASVEKLQQASSSSVSNRTGYHFQAPQNWINDPNGPMFYKGIYHLFYQFNPKEPIWGNIVWAHSYSTDLINWKPLPIAIFPSNSFDANGCWSGSATILPGNKPVIFYTGIDTQNRQVQNLAFPKNLSDPYLREWVKPAYNPVISPGDGVNASSFRDPTTAWHGPDGHWRLIIGSKWDRRGKAILYRSRDFRRWTKAKRPLHSVKDTGMWECPDFFPVSSKPKEGLDTSWRGNGLKYVLKVSLDIRRYEYYTIGSYDFSKDRYIPDGSSPDNNAGLRYDYGNFYASKTFFDQGKGRRILLGWSNESDSVQDDYEKGWAGIQTIPRALWLDSNGRQVVQWPIDEVENLRHKEASVKGKKIGSGGVIEVKGIDAAKADVDVIFDVSSSMGKAEVFDPAWKDPQKLCMRKGGDEKGGLGPFGLYVLATGDLVERTAVFFRIFQDNYNKHVVLLCHDPSRSSTKPGLYKPIYGAFVDYDIMRSGGTISLRNLIDRSVVESFAAGGRTCITSRVYPSYAVGIHSQLFAFNNGDGDVTISQLKAWEMKKPLMNGF